MIAHEIKRFLTRVRPSKDTVWLLPATTDAPCSRQGLPPLHVTMHSCGLLPRSFHLFPPKGGCLVSVALSLRSLSVVVNNCQSLVLPGLSSLPCYVEQQKTAIITARLAPPVYLFYRFITTRYGRLLHHVPATHRIQRLIYL